MMLSGWVRTVYYYDLDDGKHCFLKGSVNCSQCLNDQPHRSWVAVMKSGTIVTAHCSCMAGYVISFITMGVHGYPCMYVCTYIHMYVCVHACLHACLCMCICMYVCMRVCMFVCTHACMYVCTFIERMDVCTCSYVFIGWERCVLMLLLCFLKLKHVCD